MKYAIYIMMALMVIGFALATTTLTVDVTCDEGRWNSDICRDFELQDEFDSVTDYVNAVHYEMEFNNANFDERLNAQESKVDQVGSSGVSKSWILSTVNQSFSPLSIKVHGLADDYAGLLKQTTILAKNLYYLNSGYYDIYTNSGGLGFGTSPLGNFERLW